jgi:enamine deaminase RidA (YjgF/YER057c/UK114 family)
MPLERIQPQGLADLPTFTQVIKAGNTVYISGQIAFNAQGELVGAGDITAQATQVFENLKIALAAAGAGFAQLAKLTVFVTDGRYREAVSAVRRQYLGSPDPVTSTFLVVAGLARPELLLEIEAIAVLD